MDHNIAKVDSANMQAALQKTEAVACEMIRLEDLNNFQPIRDFWITVEAKVDSANAQAAPQKTVAAA